MKRRYVTVQVDTEVDVRLDEILDGMSNEDKRELLRQIEKDLGNAASGPHATVSLADAILTRHREGDGIPRRRFLTEWRPIIEEGQCGADITHRDEHHRQSVCVRASGHSGAHDDGQGCVWTGGNQ